MKLPKQRKITQELVLGNCLELLCNYPNGAFDLIVTDPPYRTTKRGNKGGTGGMFAKKLNNQGSAFKFNNISCEDYAPEFYRLLKDGSHCYVMTNHTNLIHMLNTFTQSGFHFIKSLIWNKGNKIVGNYYMSQFEYILFFRKGRGVRINHCGTSDILSVPNVKTKGDNNENLHDTEKPVELMRILIENSSKLGDKVLDPFVGIGSTALACKNSNRNFLGIEIDPHYFKIAKERLKENG